MPPAARDRDDLGLGIVAADDADGLQPLLFGHDEVGHDHIDGVVPEHGNAFAPVRRDDDLIAAGLETETNRIPYQRLIFDHKNDCHLPNVRRSEEHTSELQSLMRISYAVFCLKKKNI